MRTSFALLVMRTVLTGMLPLTQWDGLSVVFYLDHCFDVSATDIPLPAEICRGIVMLCRLYCYPWCWY